MHTRTKQWLTAAFYVAVFLAFGPTQLFGQQQTANFCLNPNFSSSTPGSARFIACGTEVPAASVPTTEVPAAGNETVQVPA